MQAMDDGVRLLTRVYLSEGLGPFPTLLVRNPYVHIDDDSSIAAAAVFHTARGYASVWQSVRGTAGSEGTFYSFVNEARNGSAASRWNTAQGWSNGRLEGPSGCPAKTAEVPVWAQPWFSAEGKRRL